ncbi:unnamed protein product, partial [Brenthis ino]
MTSVQESTPEQEKISVQEARAKLRESFLKAISELRGESCNIITYEQSTLEAKFSGWKPDSSEILVSDLKTPANIIIPSALLRTPDVLAINFDKPLELS